MPERFIGNGACGRLTPWNRACGARGRGRNRPSPQSREARRLRTGADCNPFCGGGHPPAQRRSADAPGGTEERRDAPLPPGALRPRWPLGGAGRHHRAAARNGEGGGGSGCRGPVCACETVRTTPRAQWLFYRGIPADMGLGNAGGPNSPGTRSAPTQSLGPARDVKWERG